MTIIVFLVDTSASMNQRAFVNGKKTLLDISKEAVEVFVKQRQKSAESRGDRYMLLTFDEFPRNIKAGWKENLATFMTELKNLEAAGMTTMGSALKAVFDTLNINRMQSGIDMYGQGRYPYYLEPAVIVVVTDGGKLTTLNQVQKELNLPMAGGAVGGLNPVPGAELTREPFRWDQRLYALVLRMAGHPPLSGAGGESGHVASDNSPIDAMCEVTGGRSYAVTSSRVLHQCIESLVQKLQSGVVIHFEKIGSDPPMLTDQEEPEVKEVETVGVKFGGLGPGSRPHTPNSGLNMNMTTTTGASTAWHSQRKLIYVQRSAQKGFAVGFWPLPEAFWPDVTATSLPPRSAHPTLKFTCTNQEPMVIENLPFDKYELEPSPLTLFILGRKQPNYCWQVFIQGSTRNGDTGHPFGYLKASTNLLTVNLFVLPYNYPMLLPLLDDLFKVHRLKPGVEWRTQFHNYLRTMPPYYAGPLRRALSRMGAGNLATNLIPEAMDNSLSYSVLNYLKRLKNQAKIEYDRIVSLTPHKGKFGPDGIKVIQKSHLKRDLIESLSSAALRDQVTDFPGYMLGLPQQKGIESHPLRNPFDIPRTRLLDQLVRMRANLIGGGRGRSGVQLVDSDTRHSLPIGTMGNYQDYLKKQPMPLRELESQPVRQHMFGNPFKINKNLMMTDEVSNMVDEVQLVGVAGSPQAGTVAGRGIKRQVEQGGAIAPAPPKRRKGALPKDFQYMSPSSSPAHSVEYPTPPPSPLPTPVPQQAPPVVPPAPVRPMTNGVTVPVVGGPVYPSGKMAAWQSICDTDLDNDCDEVLVIADQPSEVIKSVKQPEVENDHIIEEVPTPKVVNHPKLPPPVDVTVSAQNTIKHETNILIESQKKETIVTNGDHDGHEIRKGPNNQDTAFHSEKENGRVNSNHCHDNQLSAEELRSIRLRNNNVRQLIYKEVKKPGKAHHQLWEMLANLQGPSWVRRQFIQEVRQEAVRFKRMRLAEQLQKRSDNLNNLNSLEDGEGENETGIDGR